MEKELEEHLKEFLDDFNEASLEKESIIHGASRDFAKFIIDSVIANKDRTNLIDIIMEDLESYAKLMSINYASHLDYIDGFDKQGRKELKQEHKNNYNTWVKLKKWRLTHFYDELFNYKYDKKT